jgi:nitrite reductase (NADH) large subunit
MDAQLDATAGGMLRRELAHMGVHLHLGTTATAILGDSQVTGVLLRDGSVLGCELVVVAAGIRPNVDLAVRAGLDVERGIVVGDNLACRSRGDVQSEVYAIGECAQHRGCVRPGRSRLGTGAGARRSAIGTLSGGALSRHEHSTKLKVAGVQLAVMGDKDPVEEDDEVISYADPARGIYK